jgi:BA14K-like protein
MSKFGIVGAAALSLALAVATPAFAAGLSGVRGGDLMDVGGFRGAQTSIGSFVPSASAAAHCAQRWAYYDRTSGKYMGDDGQWRPCM